MNAFAYSIAKKFQPRWLQLLLIFFIGYTVAAVLMFVAHPSAIATAISALVFGAAVGAAALLLLAGLFSLSGPPGSGWSPLQRGVVGFTSLLILLWLFAAIVLIPVAAIGSFGSI